MWSWRELLSTCSSNTVLAVCCIGDYVSMHYYVKYVFVRILKWAYKCDFVCVDAMVRNLQIAVTERIRSDFQFWMNQITYRSDGPDFY